MTDDFAACSFGSILFIPVDRVLSPNLKEAFHASQTAPNNLH
jgi:hypothetical protein